MKKTIPIIMVIVLAAATGASARTKLVALPEREAVTVRFDNPAATLVEEERVLTLQEGENLVDFSWKGVQIDPESIRLALLSHPEKVSLLSVSYPPGEAALVWRIHSASKGETIQAACILLGVAFVLLTAVGIWFRGADMALVWPWGH